MTEWTATMPANIALIKYMGKQKKQLPTNASLSFTSPKFSTEVSLKVAQSNRFDRKDLDPKRFLAHLSYLQNYFGIQEKFEITSTNHFPGVCGLASSASSFAALTECFAQVVQDMKPSATPTTQIKAQLSRMGSGSSCRSFYQPFAIWSQDHVSELNLPYSSLQHYVVMVDPLAKKVSSSEAHLRIQTSALNTGRPDRAQARLDELIAALKIQDWPKAFELCWQEFWDMHALFYTSSPPFYYLNHQSIQVLNQLYQQWQIDQDGPLITVDAGPNIHLLFREDQPIEPWLKNLSIPCV
ncbi:MAG TPA: diphosphomevalonate decarboxylase [Gammaproteobacteria bacterium]|nr:diphosphomevalonate decarboxylase [Gammaproteobacteria bacterium]